MAVPIHESGVSKNVRYGDEVIPFELLFRPKEKKKVQIKVYPCGRVVALAAETVSEDEVFVSVKKRVRWIYEKRRDFAIQSKHWLPRKYLSGESHCYLGRQYQLKVIEIANQKPSVKLFRGSLEISVKQREIEQVKKTLESWYRERAKQIFSTRLEELLPQTLWVFSDPHIRIQKMKTQWGSCSPNGVITLNPNLVKAPRVCIDYVILHELCHIAEHNHSDRFYRLMNQVMPDWEAVKDKLDNMAWKILGD